MNTAIRPLLRKIIPLAIRHQLVNRYRESQNRLDNWSLDYTYHKLAQQFKPVVHTSEQPVVLFVSHSVRLATASMVSPISHMEALMAKHLELTQGVKPVFFFNNRENIDRSIFNAMGLRHWLFADEIQAAGSAADYAMLEQVRNFDLEQVNNFTVRGVPIGRLALASARRDVLKSQLETDEDWEVLYQKLKEAVDTLVLAENVLDSVRPAIVITNHSTYVEPGGTFFHAALSWGLPTVTAKPHGGPNHIIIRHYSLDEAMEHAHGLSRKEWEVLKNSPNRSIYIEEARQFLENRVAGNIALPAFSPKIGLKHQNMSLDTIRFPKDKPIVGIFSHLPWDAAGSYYYDLFPSHRQWIEFTVQSALENDRVNWIFRVHPAEAVHGTKEQTADVIRSLLPDGADHIQVIDSATPISSYALARKMIAGITVRGTLATELPCLGVPMICAGTGQTSLADYNISPTSIAEYQRILHDLPQISPLTEAQINEALLAAYGHFVYKPIQLSCLHDFLSQNELRKLRAEDLVNDAGMQRVTAEIMETIKQPV